MHIYVITQPEPGFYCVALFRYILLLPLLLKIDHFYLGSNQYIKHSTRHIVIVINAHYLPIFCSYPYLIDEDTEVRRNGSLRSRLHMY